MRRSQLLLLALSLAAVCDAQPIAAVGRKETTTSPGRPTQSETSNKLRWGAGATTAENPKPSKAPENDPGSTKDAGPTKSAASTDGAAQTMSTKEAGKASTDAATTTTTTSSANKLLWGGLTTAKQETQSATETVDRQPTEKPVQTSTEAAASPVSARPTTATTASSETNQVCVWLYLV